MRNKIRWLIIRFANWIGTKEYYDLGSEITGLIAFNKNLFVATRYSVYKYDGKKYIKVKANKE
jgi:hypothetical protein